MDNTQRFTDKVENYVRFRPGYPSGIIASLTADFGLTSNAVIADIGSGTGISTEMFLQNGNEVYAVEPNNAMRFKAEELLRSYRQFHSVHGSAESTLLKDHSIDFIIAGQAFHWFDIPQARKEFQRIAKPDGQVALFWNIRDLHSPFAQAYEQLLLDFGTDYLSVGHQELASPERVAAFFAPNTYQVRQFPNNQHLNMEGVKGRLLSTSYIPSENALTYHPMLNRLQEIFDKYAEEGKVWFDYTTTLYVGEIGA